MVVGMGIGRLGVIQEGQVLIIQVSSARSLVGTLAKATDGRIYTGQTALLKC